MEKNWRLDHVVVPPVLDGNDFWGSLLNYGEYGKLTLTNLPMKALLP